jgi:O-antigen ligase
MTSRSAGIRLGLVCLAAASVGLSMAIVSIGKVVLVIALLSVLLWHGNRRPANQTLQQLWTPAWLTLILFVFAISLLWTSAPVDQALGALGKYGKLLVIPALLVLIRTRREAACALVFFLGAQVFLLVSSWLLYLQVPLPWATSNMARNFYAVFSSYLDQGIMSAVVAAIFWHLRTLAPNRGLFYGAIALALLALGNVFIVFVGRTGYLVGMAMVSLAIFWALPRKYRLVSLLVPPLMLLIALSSSDRVAQRLSIIQSEVSAYSVNPEFGTSSGVRLTLWTTSAEAILQKPLMGAGAGSWITEYNRIQHLKNPAHQALGARSHGNPHQEYLLWGVQLGAGGMLLLLAFFGAALRDLLRMDSPIARAGQSVLLALAVSCLFNSSLYDAYIGDFFCVSLGVLLAYGFYNRKQQDAVAGDEA